MHASTWLFLASPALLFAALFGWLGWLRLRIRFLERGLEDRQSKLRDFAIELIRTEEDQRARIARELHDGVGQMMTALNLELESLHASAPGALSTQIEDLRALSTQVTAEMRRISHELRPAALDELGLTDALRALTRRMTRPPQLTVELVTAGPLEGLPADAAITCYRFVQETLNNVVRHAEASVARVELRRDAQQVRVAVRDNGRGYDPARVAAQSQEGGHYGLIGLEERIMALGGRFQIEPLAGGGTLVTAELPA